jgi:hypothetical protein
MSNTACRFLFAILMLWLAGCTSTIRSDVTAFHQWDGALAGAGFAFERAPDQADSLEHQAYEGMVRDELVRLGLREAAAGQARLKVRMNYAVQARDVVVREDVADPFWHDPWWPYRRPFWPGPYWAQREYTARLYDRSLSVAITDGSGKAGGRKVFEATARSQGSIGQLPVVMPYLVRSLFLDFPGTSGKVREVRLPVED